MRAVKEDKVEIDIEIQVRRKKRDTIHHSHRAAEATKAKEVKIAIKRWEIKNNNHKYPNSLGSR